MSIKQLVLSNYSIFFRRDTMLKKAFFIVCGVLIVGSLSASAQSSFPMGLGPFLAAKAGVNTAEIINGTKTGMTFNSPPDFGATFYFPFSKHSTVAATIDLGYYTASILTKPESGATDATTVISSAHFFSIAPSFNFSSFMLGLNFGLPMSANVSNKSGSISIDPGTDDVATLIEIRLGGMIPIYQNETGRLNFTVTGAYALTGLSKSDKSDYNPKAASLSMGLNYLFTLKSGSGE